jgi:hypothetical protein
MYIRTYFFSLILLDTVTCIIVLNLIHIKYLIYEIKFSMCVVVLTDFKYVIFVTFRREII